VLGVVDGFLRSAAFVPDSVFLSIVVTNCSPRAASVDVVTGDIRSNATEKNNSDFELDMNASSAECWAAALMAANTVFANPTAQSR
jgi:hypothetical protein